MSIFNIPTYDTLRLAALSIIKSFRTDASAAPGSDADILSRTLAHIGHSLHLHLRYGVVDLLIPTKASGWYLDAWAWLFGLPDGSGGYGRIKARGSSAEDGMEFTAVGATADLQGEQFQSSGGIVFQIDESYSFVGAGTTTLDVAAVDTGIETNIEVGSGETFTWVSTPANMSTTMTQQVDFDNGVDKETDEELRARLAENLQTPAQGGNWSQWKAWIESASPGALTGYVWHKRKFSDSGGYGYGTTDFLCLQRNETGTSMHISASSALYDLIDTAVEDNGPVLLMLQARQLTINNSGLVYEIDFDLGTSATENEQSDFDAGDLDAVVASYNEGLLEIATDKTVTGHMTAGDRAIFYFAPTTAGTDAYVEAIVTKVGIADGATNDLSFRIDAWQWATGSGPATGVHVQSGGGLIGVNINALQVYADARGPAKGPQAAPIPGWDDSVRHIGIQTVVINTGAGAIIDANVVLPATDQTPAYSDGATVIRYTASEIVCWENK